MESVRLTTADGVALEGDLLMADVPPTGGRPAGGVVVCHPHPQYGGNRFNPVVDAVFRHLAAAGLTALRFDFRPEFGGGIAERHDVVAALDELERRDAGALFVVGYSFGAAVALNVPDERVGAIVAVAPPLGMMSVEPADVPMLVLVPRHDQFTDPDVARSIVAAWPHAEFEVVESVDHFLVGRAQAVAAAAGSWLIRRL